VFAAESWGCRHFRGSGVFDRFRFPLYPSLLLPSAMRDGKAPIPPAPAQLGPPARPCSGAWQARPRQARVFDAQLPTLSAAARDAPH